MNKFKEGDKVVIIGKSKTKETRLPIGSFNKISSIEDGFSVIDEMWLYPFESLQLKSEYDMQNKTDVKRIPFDLERAKKGDKVVATQTGAIGVLVVVNDYNGHSDYIFQFTHSDGNQSICSFSEQLNKWHSGWLQSKIPSDFLMAPVEKKGWIGIFKSDPAYLQSGNTAAITNVYDSEISLLDHIQKEWMTYELICTKEIAWTE